MQQSNKNQQKANKQSKQNKPSITTQFTGEWEWLPTINEDEGPSSRCGHTLTIHGKQLDHLTAIKDRRNYKSTVDRDDKKSNLGTKRGKLLVSFGESSLLASREYLDDMYLLDIATLKWAKILGKDVLDEYKPFIKANFNPVARADHAAVSFGDNEDRALFFGGKCKDTYLDDLIHVKNICNFPINQDEQEIYENSFNNRSRFGNNKHPNMPRPFYTDYPLKIESIHLPKGPCGRRGSSLAPWKEGSFLLFGGQRGSIFFNDLWGLDLYKQGWVELATRKNPMERAFHSAFVDSQQQMLLLGGVRDTQANPAPADIFKLDLREGKFFKLGDKDMVPGIASALSKGHHSSHFLSQNCDLVIFSPQKATTHVLGGNVQSEHCGKCSQINAFTKTTAIKAMNDISMSMNGRRRSNRNNRHENDENYPLGTCRPATALLESHSTIEEMKSIGCNKKPLERLFVFGGYNPSLRQCTNKLFSLKFSAEACKIKDEKGYQFTPTPNIQRALEIRKQRIIQKEQEMKSEEINDDKQNNIHNNNNDNNNIIDSEMNASHINNNNNDTDTIGNDITTDKFNNERLCNVTPMRVTRRSRLSNIRSSHRKHLKSDTTQNMNDENDLENNINNNNQEMKKESVSFVSPYVSSSKSSSISSKTNTTKTGRKSTKRKKEKRVSIIQTPVRAKPMSPSKMASFKAMHQSSHANQKIDGLDPELLGKKHQRYDQRNNHQQQNETYNNPNNPFGTNGVRQQQLLTSHSGSQTVLSNHNNKNNTNHNNNGHDIKSIHWQYIERLLLNFNESLLDPENAFILEPHEVVEIIHTALPLLESDPTLIRIDGPVKVFGDIHGQLGDLMSLFKSFGYPDTNIGDIAYYKYVFLGDFVDRGHKCLEVICLLLALKIEYPDRIFLIRGNHECHAMNEMYGFYHEINDRLYPNIDTLKYLENDVLNENINLTECDRELSEYYQREEARNQKRDQLNQQKLYQLQQEGRIDEFHALQNKINDMMNNDIFDFDLEFEMVPIEKNNAYDDDNSEYLSDDISTELNFDDLSDKDKKPLLNMKKTHRKKYKTRKYFRDRADCITYLVQSFELTFRWLPLSILISDKILCVHGGIGQISTIEQIANISRPCDVVCDIQQEMDDEQRKVVDLLWSDPAEKDTDTGFQPNKRGVSCVFGSDVVRNFCNTNNIDLIIRGHQVVKDGFEYFAGGHLITLFSATNYCNVMDNAGAILCIDEKLRVLPKLVEPRPLHQHNNNNDDDDDDDDESADNLQWKTLKQFPPSPMRNSGDDDLNNNDIENNNPRHSIIDDDDTDDDELLNLDSNNKMNLQFEMEQNSFSLRDQPQSQPDINNNNNNPQFFNPPNH